MNHLRNRKSYFIEGLAQYLEKLCRGASYETVAHQLGLPPKQFQRVRKSSEVSRSVWNTLILNPTIKDSLLALCPEGWGGNPELLEAQISTRTMEQYLIKVSPPLNLDGHFKTGTRIRGQRSTYTIVKRIQSLSSSASYKAISTEGDDVFLKTLHQFPSRPSRQDHQDIAQLDARFKAEYSSHTRLKGLSGIAHVIDTIYIRDDSLPYAIPVLVQEYVDGKSCIAFLASIEARTGKPLPYERWASIARNLISTIGAVHASGVVHGDIRPENILFKGDSPVVVDFGQSFLVDTYFHKTSEHPAYLQSSAVAPERRAAAGKWSFGADVYGIGAVLFFLATGHELPRQEQDNHLLKTLVFDYLESHNPSLLATNLGVGDVLLRCLHYEIEDRASRVEELIELLDIFEQAAHEPASYSANQFRAEFDAISSSLKEIEERNLKIFLPFLMRELKGLSRKALDVLSSSFIPLVGDREEVLIGLLRYLTLLGSNDQYFTLTVPSFWSTENLGVDGRFLRLNTMLALRGVTIRRVFLLTEQELREPATQKILESHRLAIESLQEKINCSDSRPEAGGCFTGYVIIDKESRARLIQHGHHVGLAKLGKQWLAMIFRAKRRDGSVRRVEFRIEQDPEEILQEFLGYLEDSASIADEKLWIKGRKYRTKVPSSDRTAQERQE